MEKKILETDLSLPVKELLINKGFRVNSEIESCDIAAIKGDELIIVELKVSFNLELIYQAIKRQRLTDNVYIAIPKLKLMRTKKWKDICLLVKRLGLGLIVVNFQNEPYAEIIIEPSLFDISKSQKKANKRKQHLINEFNGRSLDLNTGGSTRKKILTAYKEKSLYIASCLYLLGPLSPKELKMYGADSKKTNSILSKNYLNWFKRIKTGLYYITEEGIKSISLYQEITSIQTEKIAKLCNNKDT